MRRLTILVLLICSIQVIAQKDTLFWFAVPEVSESHADRPIYLRLTSFEDNTNVKISLPATPSFDPILISLNENEYHIEELTEHIDILECKYPDSILNNGVLIESNNAIRAIYDVFSSQGNDLRPQNSDLFGLKGFKALGTDFYLPFQSTYRRALESGRAPDAKASIDIVATQDSTTITISPKGEIVNHIGESSFEILLMKGQTYSCIANGGEEYLTGTRVQSNKPIAVTLKDDSVYEGRTGQAYGWDLLGDQLYANTYCGQEFVLAEDRASIVAIEDETIITYGELIFDTLDAGEFRTLNLTDSAQFLSATHPIQILHVKALNSANNEGSASALAGITCHGLNNVLINRPTSEDFTVLLTVHTGAEDDFMINGFEWSEISSSFYTVKGNSNLKYAEISVSDIYVPSETSFVIKNTASNFDISYGLGFWQSQYVTLGETIDYIFEEDTLKICDSTITLAEAPLGFDRYFWEDQPQGRFLQLDSSGIYTLEVEEGNFNTCKITDSVYIDLLESPLFDLGNDNQFCEGSTITLTGTEGPGITHEWNTGDTTSSISVEISGTYSLTQSNEIGCTITDTIRIVMVDTPSTSLPSDTVLCQDDELLIELFWSPYINYQWADLAIDTNTRVISDSGNYQIRMYSQTTAGQVCGEINDEIRVDFWDVEVYNVLSPNGDGNNDVFVIEGIEELGNWHFKVINRWGQEVYNTDKYMNDWDAQNLSDGVYFYELSEELECTEYRGWIHVMH